MFGKRKTAPALAGASGSAVDAFFDAPADVAIEVTVEPGMAEAPPAGAGVAVSDPPAAASVFLGSLRSEVDEPDSLPEPFERLTLVTEGILGAYRRHHLTDVEAAERLRVLRLRGSDGAEWSLGPTSMRWYRRKPGGVWRRAVPTAREDALLTGSADAAIERLAQMGNPAHAAKTSPDRQPAGADGASHAEETPGYVTDPYGADALLAAESSASRDGAPDSANDGDTTDPAGSPDSAASGAVDVVAAAGSTFDEFGYDTAEDEGEDYGYGYGYEPPTWSMTPTVPTPATETGAANVWGEDPSDTAESDDVADEPIDEDQAEQNAKAAELMAMLAELSQETGIALSGLPRAATNDDPA